MCRVVLEHSIVDIHCMHVLLHASIQDNYIHGVFISYTLYTTHIERSRGEERGIVKAIFTCNYAHTYTVSQLVAY